MRRTDVAMMAALVLLSLLSGCGGDAACQASPDQMPLALVGKLFQAGYELAGYHESDLDGDGAAEALAVLTQRLPADKAFLSTSYVLLFARQAGAWGTADSRRVDGGDATTELRDLTGDGLPELVVSAERITTEEGDFVAPLRTTGYLTVFTYTQDKRLMELGSYSSGLVGQGRAYPRVGQREGQPIIQTARDLPATGSSLWQPYHVETLAWDGQGFASIQVQEQKRLSPLISWLVLKNGPWLAAFLALGGLLSWGVLVVTRRTRIEERWTFLGATLTIVAASIGLRLAQEWLCALVPILAGLVGLLVGRQVAIRQGTGSKRDGK